VDDKKDGIMAEITASLVKQLRERTGVGFMECKNALTEAGGNVEEAETILRKRGISVAQKKAGREAKEGLVGAYIHTGSKLGVLVEVNCETDFVARTDDFQQLVHDLAMHVAAADPRYIRKEDVSEDDIAREKEIQRARALQEGKPEKMVDKIVEGRMSKFYEEICLYEQPFVKDNSITVKELVTNQIAKLRENIVVSRMVRFKVGEAS
jgi:elongation factor Ts